MRLTHPRRFGTTVLLPALGLLLFLGSRASGTDTLRDNLTSLAKDVQKQLELREMSSVAIGDFTGPLVCNSGPGIAQMLHEELSILKVTLSAKAKWTIRGTFRWFNNSDRIGVIELKAWLEDTKGKRAFTMDARSTWDVPSINRVIGVTVDLSRPTTPLERNEAQKNAIEDPKPTVKENRVYASKTSLYGIELRVKRDGQYVSVPVDAGDGIPQTSLKRNDVYAIRLHNGADHHVAAQVTIDGIGLFSFFETSKGPRRQEGVFYVPPKSELDITGWPINYNESDELKVTEYAKSAAARLKSTGKLGMITVQFSPAWQGKNKPQGIRNAAGNATGFGKRVKRLLKPVVLNVGQVQAAVTIRYTK